MNQIKGKSTCELYTYVPLSLCSNNCGNGVIPVGHEKVDTTPRYLLDGNQNFITVENQFKGFDIINSKCMANDHGLIGKVGLSLTSPWDQAIQDCSNHCLTNSKCKAFNAWKSPDGSAVCELHPKIRSDLLDNESCGFTQSTVGNLISNPHNILRLKRVGVLPKNGEQTFTFESKQATFTNDNSGNIIVMETTGIKGATFTSDGKIVPFNQTLNPLFLTTATRNNIDYLYALDSKKKVSVSILKDGYPGPFSDIVTLNTSSGNVTGISAGSNGYVYVVFSNDIQYFTH